MSKARAMTALAVLMASCRKCGHEHATTVDRMACDAIHGYVMRWPDGVRDPTCMCELCGYTTALSELLDHFAAMHVDAPTGRLVRYVADTSPL